MNRGLLYRIGFIAIFVLANANLSARAQTLVNQSLAILSPIDYQIIQRNSASVGIVPIELKTASALSKDDGVEYRIRRLPELGDDWEKVEFVIQAGTLQAEISLPAGGWYRLEIRLKNAETVIATAEVEHVGVGEIFVVAGQSNSANHGEEKQQTQTGRVATFDGQRWHLANDPQPGASGQGGSLIPPLGDALARQFDVPIGFIACGIGATSVREWLPQGTPFPNPPTIESRVRRISVGPGENDRWESKGEAFEAFVKRLKPLGEQGFRAVLWHQGESDANQSDASRTLAGSLYREYLSEIIRQSRQAMGWDAPWMVAQVSYHVPGDESSADIRKAQASLWNDGLALEGPDSDSLKGELRERNGQGVHFSGQGLREHARLWAAKLAPWLQMQLAQDPSVRR